jgi:hypothetical protein
MLGHPEVPRKTLSLGFYLRSDGQRFEIKALIYELPKGQDSWLVVYDAHHEEWGHSRFTLLIPSYFCRHAVAYRNGRKKWRSGACNDSLEISRPKRS